MNFEKLDWAVLDRLRAGFLASEGNPGIYWHSLHDLEQYDLTFGERIGWKWDAVWRELTARGWRPLGKEKLRVMDWGCGSGIPGRRAIAALGRENVAELCLWDHSPHAREFAQRRAHESFPEINVIESESLDQCDVLIVSHVLNELSPASREALLAQIGKSNALVWVEPGTHAISRDLIGFREKLRAEFHVVAPCTHRSACGLLTPENAPHWCHSFAPPPPGIYADSDWVKFGQRAGIDLRSLPYSFLALEKFHETETPANARVIGLPWVYKAHAKVLGCEPSGVFELTLQKRDDPALFKNFKKGVGGPIYRWRRDGIRILEAVARYADTSSQ